MSRECLGLKQFPGAELGERYHHYRFSRQNQVDWASAYGSALYCPCFEVIWGLLQLFWPALWRAHGFHLIQFPRHYLMFKWCSSKGSFISC